MTGGHRCQVGQGGRSLLSSREAIDVQTAAVWRNCLKVSGEQLPLGERDEG